MTRTALAYAAPDLSALARALTKSLAEHGALHQRPPSHVETMNMLARAVGHRNLQSLRAASGPAAALDDDPWFDAPVVDAPTSPPDAALPALTAHAKKALEHFDAAGRLERWPIKLSVQRLAMWVLWTRFDARRVYTEAQVNQILKGWHLYGDHATLRRELINHRLMSRKSDCSEYRKLAVRPDDEARALLQALRSPALRPAGRRSSRPMRGPLGADAQVR